MAIEKTLQETIQSLHNHSLQSLKLSSIKKETQFELTKTLNGHSMGVLSVCALGCGKLASSSYDDTIKIWDSSQCEKTLTGHSDYVRSVCALENGKLASGSFDKTIKI